jgi:hypothetical protein
MSEFFYFINILFFLTHDCYNIIDHLDINLFALTHIVLNLCNRFKKLSGLELSPIY